jgi:deoxyxylulose-5-phosphate synthase
MNITQAKWVDKAQTTAHVTTNNSVMFVPADAANIDWQRVLEWIAEGNTIADYTAPTPPPINVVKAGWLRAALARQGKLAAVNAAVAQSTEEKQELWEYATEYRIDDPDVVAIAAALGIDLRTLFDLAETIRIERQGI